MNTLNFKDNQQGITRDINQKEYLSWLGGEGEGSASVSISISSTFKFGVQSQQPTFNVSQHENGLPILRVRIRLKADSEIF
jgi:hypothetical protein